MSPKPARSSAVESSCTLNAMSTSSVVSGGGGFSFASSRARARQRRARSAARRLARASASSPTGVAAARLNDSLIIVVPPGDAASSRYSMFVRLGVSEPRTGCASCLLLGDGTSVIDVILDSTSDVDDGGCTDGTTATAAGCSTSMRATAASSRASSAAFSASFSAFAAARFALVAALGICQDG